ADTGGLRGRSVEDQILRPRRVNAGDARALVTEQTGQQLADGRNGGEHQRFLPTMTMAPSAGSAPKILASARRSAGCDPRGRSRSPAYVSAQESRSNMHAGESMSGSTPHRPMTSAPAPANTRSAHHRRSGSVPSPHRRSSGFPVQRISH